MSKKCKFLTKNDTRCKADVQTGKDFCIFHDPLKVEDGRRARRAGGMKRSRPAAVLSPLTPDYPLTRPAEVSSLLADSINQLRRGQLDPGVANSIGYLSSVQLRSFEQGVLQDHIAKLEEGSDGLDSKPGRARPERVRLQGMDTHDADLGEHE